LSSLLLLALFHFPLLLLLVALALAFEFGDHPPHHHLASSDVAMTSPLHPVPYTIEAVPPEVDPDFPIALSIFETLAFDFTDF
jgi:hypothetical protein